MLDIVAVGEVLIDLTQTDIDENGIRRYAANPGGAPANVAVAAAKLGAATGFVGKVGADSWGRDLRAVLNRWGVDTHGLYETGDAPTTLAVVSLTKEGERSFTFYRAPGADVLLRAEEALAAIVTAPKILHIGSVSLTADPGRGATLAAAEQARRTGALVSYDPNYRANLWPDEATAVRWMREPLSMTNILKISDEELPLLTGTNELSAGTQKLAALGIELILVTLGAGGTYYRLGTAEGTIPGFSVKVADTNGAGDTFFGALLSVLTRGGAVELSKLTKSELEGYLRFANAAAALTCSRSGAIPAMPARDEVEAFLARG